MRRRILLAILLAVAVTTLALGIPLGYVALQQVETLTREELQTRAQQIGVVLDDDLANNREPDIADAESLVPPGGRLIVALPGRPSQSIGPDLGEDMLAESIKIVREGTVVIQVPAGPTRTRQTQVAGLVVLVVVITIAIASGVAIVTARRLAQPLGHVADRAGRLGAGDFKPDARRYGVAELDRVAEALDTSAGALAELVQRERDLVGDVSHQLRSRLTALQLRLEALQHTSDPENAADAAAALEQAERLGDVLDELLAAAREARATDAEPVDLAAALPAITGEWREPLRAKGRALRVRVHGRPLAKATTARLREAIGVLLDNAMRHGAGPVSVTVRSSDATVSIEVTDGGNGVPDELVAHIFDRGVSGVGSTGVGLALARALVESDGGRLELSVPRPATFTIFLPVPRVDDLRGVRWPAERSPR
ncbi:ATP-binding protein [Kibdelosporangium phytohabitans]|uniref:Signal transduction histidine-protein kinase/phosphatase MprB n=1 Tax=Kibdelosporangium phytohabitans TaxID=860235 RepID=A0A0N9I694_9PSEU|nr:ATP-binding protein [Kibdelosporangium phytohabitans]ALG13633.1 histidine kinase [Kibdelosporangium phytohabitans]MBE1465514.1 signal transduction histidine kinase [Kibdelosporangium phytohabitans]